MAASSSQGYLSKSETWMQRFRSEIEARTDPKIPPRTAIFPVPTLLVDSLISESKRKAYEPRLIKLGLSQVDEYWDYSPMDSCKAFCLREFMKQTGKNIDDLLGLIRQAHVERLPLQRAYFGLPESQEEAQFMRLTADCVFFLKFSRNMLYETNEPTCLSAFFPHSMSEMAACTDHFLLVNQIPLTYIKSLPWDSTMLSETLIKMSRHMNPFRFDDEAVSASPPSESMLNCQHLLDCLYTVCVGGPVTEDYSLTVLRFPGATELLKFGMKFEARCGNTRTVSFIKKTSVLQLPKIAIYAEDECILRNMIAYELTSKASDKQELCAYILFMDTLIDTSADVDALDKAGVLINQLADGKAMVEMWSSLCKQVPAKYSERWQKMACEIKQHCKITWRVWWRVWYAEFYDSFLSRPWKQVSTIAAGTLLGMTAVLVGFAILSYIAQFTP